MEAVKTNVIGTDNVLTPAIEAGVGAVYVYLQIRQPILSMLWVSPKLLRRRLL